MKFFKLAALVAAMTTASVGASEVHAQDQTRDESGAATMQFTIAKWVEFISHSPHNNIYPSNIAPGGSATGELTREFRANTTYALSISGLGSDGKLRFVGAAGEEILVDAACATWDSSPLESGQPTYGWNCLGGSTFLPKSHTQWATLRLTLVQAPFAPAGVYTATVYFVIEAA